jgi:hypothetical protein
MCREQRNFIGDEVNEYVEIRAIRSDSGPKSIAHIWIISKAIHTIPDTRLITF